MNITYQYSQPSRLLLPPIVRELEPLYYSARKGEDEFRDKARTMLERFPHFDIKELRDGDRDMNLLCAAVLGGNAENVRLCLELGLAPGTGIEGDRYEVDNLMGWQPVHLAATVDAPDSISVLLRGGADLEAKITCGEHEGQTPLIVAVSNWVDCPRNVEALVAAGAHMNAVDAAGRTALMLALADNAADSVIEVLLAAGADLDAGNWLGETGRELALRLFMPEDMGRTLRGAVGRA